MADSLADGTRFALFTIMDDHSWFSPAVEWTPRFRAPASLESWIEPLRNTARLDGDILLPARSE